MSLNDYWFTEGYIDFELQKYRLLGYLQKVEEKFKHIKLYPDLADVIHHYENLLKFKQEKENLQLQFPKKIKGLNAESIALIYQKLIADDELMDQLNKITDYGLVQIQKTIQHGTEVYDFVERKLHMEPVGILPLYKNEGYLFIKQQASTAVQTYQYTITIFENEKAKYKGIRLEFINQWQKSSFTSYEQIKKEVIAYSNKLPNPATFSVESAWSVPIYETILPIAKRMLVKHISSYGD